MSKVTVRKKSSRNKTARTRIHRNARKSRLPKELEIKFIKVGGIEIF